MSSSIGFHTLSLLLPIKSSDLYPLIYDFLDYSHRSKKIKMSHTYKRDGVVVSEPFRVDSNGTFILPLHTTINYRDDIGISWEINCQTHNPSFNSYHVAATINPKILSGIDDYITASTLDSMDTAISAFNQEAKRISPLLKEFNSYRITRIDYCLNFSLTELAPMCSPQQMMSLIKRSNIPQSYREWTKYDPVAHRVKSQPSSFYLIGNYVNINCYSKRMQLEEKTEENHRKGYPPIPQKTLDASTDIIRFEVQCKYLRTYTLAKRAMQSLPAGIDVYRDLLCYSTCVEQISAYYAKTIGKGDWYSLQEAIGKIKGYGFNIQKESRLLGALQLVNQCRSVAKAKELHQGEELEKFKQTLKELSYLGINPVTIPKEWKIKHIPNLLYAFFDRREADRLKKEEITIRDKLIREALREHYI